MANNSETLSWAQKVEPYDGPFRHHFRTGVQLLAECERGWKTNRERHLRSSRLAVRLGFGTSLLAAIAGITVLPDGMTRWVSAATAFGAAGASELSRMREPQRRAEHARLQAKQWEDLRHDVDAYLRWLRSLPDTAPVRQLEVALDRLEHRRRRIGEQVDGAHVAPLGDPTTN